MRKLRARVCRAGDSVFLRVPADIFRQLGGQGDTPLNVEVLPIPRPKDLPERKGWTAAEMMARYREVLRLKREGLENREIVEALGVSHGYVDYVCRRLKSADLNTTETHLTSYANFELTKAFGLHNPPIIDLQKVIEADPLWRLKLLRCKCSRTRLKEIEAFCMENGIRIEPGVHNIFEGLSVKSFEVIQRFTGKPHPRSREFQMLMDNKPKGFAEALEQDPALRLELDEYYKYKSERNWF